MSCRRGMLTSSLLLLDALTSAPYLAKTRQTRLVTLPFMNSTNDASDSMNRATHNQGNEGEMVAWGRFERPVSGFHFGISSFSN